MKLKNIKAQAYLDFMCMMLKRGEGEHSVALQGDALWLLLAPPPLLLKLRNT